MRLQILTDESAFWQSRCASAIKAAAEKQGADCVVSSRPVPLDPCDSLLVFGDCDTIPETQADVFLLSDVVPCSIEKAGRFKKIFVPPFDGSGEIDVSGGNILVTGIPVPYNSAGAFSKEAARNYLVVGKDQKIVLIAAEGMSVRETKALCAGLNLKAGGNVSVWIFSERESERKSELEKAFVKSRNVQIMTYTEKINIYIKAADMIITSPDVIALTEAFFLGVPPVIWQTEKVRAKSAALYFASNDMAYLAHSSADAAEKASTLLESAAIRERIVNSQRRYAIKDPAGMIAEALIRK